MMQRTPHQQLPPRRPACTSDTHVSTYHIYHHSESINMMTQKTMRFRDFVFEKKILFF